MGMKYNYSINSGYGVGSLLMTKSGFDLRNLCGLMERHFVLLGNINIFKSA